MQPARVLEVGVGDGVVASYLRANSAVHYQSLDIAEDLHPDMVGSVTAIPLSDRAVDVACAFEVLEHLPFAEFATALRELMRVSSRAVIISLPHFGPAVRFACKIPFLPAVDWMVKIPFPKRHVWNGQHYWEIGKRGYSVRRIRSIIRQHAAIVREFVPHENAYHHFFVLQPYATLSEK